MNLPFLPTVFLPQRSVVNYQIIFPQITVFYVSLLLTTDFISHKFSGALAYAQSQWDSFEGSAVAHLDGPHCAAGASLESQVQERGEEQWDQMLSYPQ